MLVPPSAILVSEESEIKRKNCVPQKKEKTSTAEIKKIDNNSRVHTISCERLGESVGPSRSLFSLEFKAPK